MRGLGKRSRGNVPKDSGTRAYLRWSDKGKKGLRLKQTELSGRGRKQKGKSDSIYRVGLGVRVLSKKRKREFVLCEERAF